MNKSAQSGNTDCFRIIYSREVFDFVPCFVSEWLNDSLTCLHLLPVLVSYLEHSFLYNLIFQYSIKKQNMNTHLKTINLTALFMQF